MANPSIFQVPLFRLFIFIEILRDFLKDISRFLFEVKYSMKSCNLPH